MIDSASNPGGSRSGLRSQRVARRSTWVGRDLAADSRESAPGRSHAQRGREVASRSGGARTSPRRYRYPLLRAWTGRMDGTGTQQRSPPRALAGTRTAHGPRREAVRSGGSAAHASSPTRQADCRTAANGTRARPAGFPPSPLCKPLPGRCSTGAVSAAAQGPAQPQWGPSRATGQVASSPSGPQGCLSSLRCNRCGGRCIAAGFSLAARLWRRSAGTGRPYAASR